MPTPPCAPCAPPNLCAPSAAFSHPVRVYWEDTDAGGIVYYANYLRFFERARTEWLRTLGLAQRAMREATGVLFVVSEARLRYLRAARLDDLLGVTVAVAAAGRASLMLAQQAWRGAELLADGDIRLACVDVATMRPRRLPAELISRLAA